MTKKSAAGATSSMTGQVRPLSAAKLPLACDMTISVRFMLPDTMMTIEETEPHRDFITHHLGRGAQELPRKAYLEFDAQPAMITMPYTSMEVMAITNSRACIDIGQGNIRAEGNHRPMQPERA